MKARLAVVVLAMAALPAASMPGYFNADAPEQKEAPAPTAKLSSSCSLWIRYNPDHPRWQEIHFLGEFFSCSGSSMGLWVAAATQAAIGLPSPKGDSVGPSAPMPDTPTTCAININFEPASPGGALTVVTGPDTCAATKNEALAMARDSLKCVYTGGRCPPGVPGG